MSIPYTEGLILAGTSDDGAGRRRVVVLVVLHIRGRGWLTAEHARGKGAYLDRTFMADQGNVAVPGASGDYGDGADGAVYRVGSCNVCAIGRPGAAAKVGGEGGGCKGSGNGGFENEVAALVVGGGVWQGRGEAVDAHCAVIASGCKVFVGGIKGDALDVTLVLGKRLKLLKRVSRPHDDFRIEADRDEDGRVVGPAQVLDIVVVAYQSPVDAPILDGGCFV